MSKSASLTITISGAPRDAARRKVRHHFRPGFWQRVAGGLGWIAWGSAITRQNHHIGSLAKQVGALTASWAIALVIWLVAEFVAVRRGSPTGGEQ